MSLTTTISQMNSALEEGVFALSLADMDATLTSASDRFSIVSASFSNGVTTVIFSDAGTADGYICKLYSDSELTTLIDTQFSEDLEVKFDTTQGVQYWMTVTEGILEVVDPAPPPPQTGLDSTEGDLAALEALYVSANGASWDNNTGWASSGMDLNNNIYGVTVENNRVVKVKLNGTDTFSTTADGLIGSDGVLGGNNLTGSLPDEIGNLKKCTYFNVKNNYLTGAIPDEVGGMSSLEQLLLSGRFNDAYPPTGSGLYSTKADEPALTNNFTGELPSSIGNLTNLVSIELVHINQFSPGLTGTIPLTLNNLVNLRYLILGRNSFTSIPDLSGMQSLELISLSANIALNGEPFPYWMSQVHTLKWFTFQGIEWAPGTVPDLSELKGLQRFSGMRGNFTGSIPSWLTDGTLPVINEIYLSWNDMSETLPEFGNVGLIAFTASGNNLTGSVPDSFWDNNPQIKNTNFGWNSLSGPIKSDGNLRHLNNIRNLRWADNEISGQWPDLDWTNQQGHTESDGVTPRSPLAGFLRAQFSANKYVFRDMLYVSDEAKTLFQWYAEEAEEDFWYSPQKPFGVTTSVVATEGSNLLLEPFESNVSHPDNVYQWQKDGVDISGATSKSLEILNVGASDEGVYNLIVRNTLMESLVDSLRFTYPEVDRQGYLTLTSEDVVLGLEETI